MSYRDLTEYTFWDETSMFDPDPSTRWVGGAEYYERKYTVFVPERLLRRRPDLVDDFITKYEGEDWLYGEISR